MLEEIITYVQFPADSARRRSFRDLWTNRIRSLPENVDTCHMLLRVTALAVPPLEMCGAMVHFMHLCSDEGVPTLADEVLTGLLGCGLESGPEDKMRSPVVTCVISNVASTLKSFLFFYVFLFALSRAVMPVLAVSINPPPATHTQTHTDTHARAHTDTHRHSRARAHTHTHARTHRYEWIKLGWNTAISPEAESIARLEAFVHQLDVRGGARGVVTQRDEEMDFESEHLLSRSYRRLGQVRPHLFSLTLIALPLSLSHQSLSSSPTFTLWTRSLLS
jgi:hypothetical protein